jgi:4-diphosphocytidyl-2-C-methyl-D-erythritol kinase
MIEPHTKLILHAPGKINWFLSIINRRDDGYHNIVSALQFIDLFDRLSFERAEKIELISDIDVPVEKNLVFRAAQLLKEYSSFKGGARITLEKNIPVAAGLGGGSSDAAFTLVGLNRLWELDLSLDVLLEIGLQIGSDVPFFFLGPFSLIEGRGEGVKKLEKSRSVTMLLVKPEISVSASWAYNAYEAELTKKHIDIKLFCRALDRQDYVSLQCIIFNDLEKPVVGVYREVSELKTRLIENGAALSLMSGSGPTVFGVFNSEDEAATAAKGMDGVWYRVVRTLTPEDGWLYGDKYQ